VNQCKETKDPSFNLDTVRGFHFASILNVPYDLPQDSLMHIIMNETIQFPENFVRDSSNELDLYLDPENNIGRFASTFYQGNINKDFSYFLNRGPVGVAISTDFEAYCGEVTTHCPQDPNSPYCHLDGDCDYFGGGGGCGTPGLANAAKENGLTSLLPSTFNNFYKLRDDILEKSERGRNYIRRWYKRSMSIRFWESEDIPGSMVRLTRYLNLAVEIDNRLSNLFDESYEGEVILIDTNLKNQLLLVIDEHRGISPELEKDLNILQQDIEYLSEKSKDEVLGFFQVLSE